MDTSETYIKMMRRNPDMLYAKWERGFDEGDYVYDGKTIHILGHDYIGVKQFFEPSDYSPFHKLRLALYEPLSAVAFVAESGPTAIDIKDGKYVILSLNHAIWLPTESQLQEMCHRDDGSSLIGRITRFGMFIEVNKNLHEVSWEQAWLHYYMRWELNKVWNGDGWVKEA